MAVYVVNNYRADQTDILWNATEKATSNTLKSTDIIDFTGYTTVDSAGGNARNVTFEAPKINMKSEISIRNDANNSITFNNALVNFDDAIWDPDTDYQGRIFFTGTASLEITTNSIGKTLIYSSTLSGTIPLVVGEGVQTGDSFSVRSTDNQLVITDGEWSATPSTSGDITTYTLTKATLQKPKFRLLYTVG